MTVEIQSYWEVRGDVGQAHLYEQMLLSLAWGLYGAALIAIGMWRQFATLRYIGIVIIATTSLKVFFYDLWELGGIYRVIGFIGFGALLVLVSYLYQNRRAQQRPVLSEREARVEGPVQSEREARAEGPVLSEREARAEGPVQTEREARAEGPVQSEREAPAEGPVLSEREARAEGPVQTEREARVEGPDPAYDDDRPQF
jgi:hypothetical protein